MDLTRTHASERKGGRGSRTGDLFVGPVVERKKSGNTNESGKRNLTRNTAGDEDGQAQKKQNMGPAKRRSREKSKDVGGNAASQGRLIK